MSYLKIQVNKKYSSYTNLWMLMQNDLKHIFRDSTLLFFLFMPFVLLVFIRSFVPYLTEYYPVVSDYHLMIMMGAGIQTCTLFGFIISFIILDEKDENVLQVIRILPMSPYYFLVYRLLFGFIGSFMGAWIVIQFSEIAHPGNLNAILLAIQYGLISPMICLLVTSLAKNKIEGMAFFKIINLFLLLPILFFFFDYNIRYGLAIFPTFWTFRSYEAFFLEENGATSLFLTGLIYYIIFIVGLAILFKHRQFK